METGRTTGTQTWVCSTHTVTIRYTVNGTTDKAPRTEEPRDREIITRGSVVAVGRATGPLTHSGAIRSLETAHRDLLTQSTGDEWVRFAGSCARAALHPSLTGTSRGEETGNSTSARLGVSLPNARGHRPAD